MSAYVACMCMFVCCVDAAGSPFMVNVGGDPSGRSRETVTRQIQAAELVSVGQKCDLQLRIPGMYTLAFHTDPVPP